MGAGKNVFRCRKEHITGAVQILGAHLIHTDFSDGNLIPHLVPQAAVCSEQVQDRQQLAVGGFRVEGQLFFEGALVAFISIDHGVCFLLFFFCVQGFLNSVGFWSVGFIVRALVSGGHRLAPTEPAGETWCFMKRSKAWSVGLLVKRGIGFLLSGHKKRAT